MSIQSISSNLKATQQKIDSQIEDISYIYLVYGLCISQHVRCGLGSTYWRYDGQCSH
jgi:hypothetical protein